MADPNIPARLGMNSGSGLGGGAAILGQYASISGGAISPSGGLVGSSGSGMVYMGTKKKSGTMQDIGPDGRRITVPISGTEDITMSLDEARGLPALWAREDPKKLRDFVNKGIIAKIPKFDSDMGLPEIMDAWDDMLKASVALSERGQKWSPWDIMDTYGNTAGKFGTERRGDWVYDIATGKPVKYVGPTSKTTTDRRVNLSSVEDVRAIAVQAMTEALGRAPTTQEVAQFATAINGMERANPQVTTTTSTLKPNLATGEVETVAQDSTTTGGVSTAAMQQMISEQASGTSEAAKYQSGTTYFNALLALIGGG